MLACDAEIPNIPSFEETMGKRIGITRLNNNSTSRTSEPLHWHFEIRGSMISNTPCWDTRDDHGRLSITYWPVFVGRSQDTYYFAIAAESGGP